MKTRFNKLIKRKRINRKRRTMKKGGSSGKGWKTGMNSSKKSSKPKVANASLIKARRLFGSIGEAH